MRSTIHCIKSALIGNDTGKRQLSPRLLDSDLMDGYISRVLESGNTQTLTKLTELANQVSTQPDLYPAGLKILTKRVNEISEEIEKREETLNYWNRIEGSYGKER
jgi:hypothetical protein